MKNKKEESTLTTEVKALRTDVNSIQETLDDVIKKMATKDDFKRLALVVEKNSHDIEGIKETINTRMATKDDIQHVLNHIDSFAKRVSGFDQEEGVQSFHLEEVRHQVNDHEKGIVKLESAK